MSSSINRRRFIQDSAATVACLAVAAELGPGAVSAEDPPSGGFASRWDQTPDRIWPGPEYWSNPLQDWRVSGGRLESARPAADRHVHLLIRHLGDRPGTLAMSVRVGRVGGGPIGKGKGSFGFRIGIRGPLEDHRNSLIFGNGLDVGLAADGRVFFGDPARPASALGVPLDRESVELRLSVHPAPNGYAISLSAVDPESGRSLGEVRSEGVPADRLVGNLALVVNFAGSPASSDAPKAKAKAKAKTKAAGSTEVGAFWFADWRVSGSKVDAHEDRAFGPIFFSQYTLSMGTWKLTAQMPPLGEGDSRTVRLQVRDGDDWSTVAEEPIHPEARTATFRKEDCDHKGPVAYRLAYTLKSVDGSDQEHYWTGTLRPDPVDKPVITLADVSCNTHAAFPNAPYVASMASLDPDLIAFVGDQFYESTGGYGVVRDPVDVAIVDYLRKWIMHGWTWRELTRDRPSLSIPDDHDVYQGNIWGEAGAPQTGTQEQGGYQMDPAWVNVVHRTQASHHPDPYDPTPVRQGISVYYGPLTYGRISFAVIADRQFKSAPEGKVPPTGDRGDHVVDSNFDPRTADIPGLDLLGDRQLAFLRDWAADWRGAEMKAVLSQTIFNAMATTHGGDRQRLRADYDANGWPQSARNRALREIRKAFAVHIAGDQHLPAVVHYGIDGFRDAAVAFAGPAVNVGYPRWWEPLEAGRNRKPGDPEGMGDHLDHFGNPMTVLAFANGAIKPRPGVMETLQDRASGLALVRFDKPNRAITFECWPFLADVAKPGTQFPGWPVSVRVLDNHRGDSALGLPTLQVRGVDHPVVQVIDEGTGELIYAIRIVGTTFRPHVFAPGRYTVKVVEPESGRSRELGGLVANEDRTRTLEVVVPG